MGTTDTKTTSRLVLRQPTPDDVNSVYAIYGDAQTNTFNPSGPLKDIDSATAVLHKWIQHWQANKFGQWAIATLDNPDEVIGFGGLTYYDFGGVMRLNVGYRFAVAAWGKGYATELSKAAIAYGFTDLDMPEIYGIVRPAHDASIKVLEKVGMVCVDELDDVPGQAKSLVYCIKRP